MRVATDGSSLLLSMSCNHKTLRVNDCVFCKRKYNKQHREKKRREAGQFIAKDVEQPERGAGHDVTESKRVVRRICQFKKVFRNKERQLLLTG